MKDGDVHLSTDIDGHNLIGATLLNLTTIGSRPA